MIYRATAPSNIALIKYMGKTDATINRPSNPSLSYSLAHLTSTVEVEFLGAAPGVTSSWKPVEGLEKLDLSEKGQKRFLAHFESLCREFGVEGNFQIRSGNNFPAACGLASSASSFAALTKAFGQVLQSQKSKKLSREELSRLSQRGSGSSCRSLFDEWALWEDQGASEMQLPQTKLLHDVILLDAEEKEVSSSEAHKRVTSSLCFEGRASRANQRLRELVASLKEGQWANAYQICWEEFWDMHSLFETSRPSFGYMNGMTICILGELRDFWSREQDGPLVTMDAGPNVHLLWREDQAIKRTRLRQRMASQGYEVWPRLEDHD